MKIKQEQISSTQLMFSIVCYILGSSLLTGYITGVTRQDSWISIVSGYIVSLPILGIYTALAKKFPGKNIIEITINTFGKFLGRIISIFYIFFFFSLAFLNTRNMGDFMTGYIMPETPMLAFFILFVFVCAWTVRKGVETMTRYSVLFFIITIATILFNFFLMINNIKLRNFFPMFSLPISKYIQATHTVAILPFCEILAFFMLFPYVKESDKIKKSLYSGLTIGATSFLILMLRDTSVLGAINYIFSAPTFEVIRLINIGVVFTRIESIYAAILVMLSFFRVSITFFATVSSIAQTFNLHSYKILVLIFGVLIIIFSLIVFDSASESDYWGKNVAAVYSTFFELLLPVITLLVAVIKEKLVSKEVKMACK